MATAVIAGIVGAAGAGITAVAAVGGFSLFGFGIAGTMAAAFAIGSGLSMISTALMPKPSYGQQMTGTDITVREPDASRKMVYGRIRLGGAIVYIDSTGTDNEYIHMVIAMAGHEIDAFEEVYFNNDKIWDNGSFVGSWGTYVYLGLHDGSQTTADSALVAASAQWTDDHKLLDVAYMYVRLKYDAEEFAQGLPNISAVIRGKKVYNPVTGVTEWTQNPALCVYDYLRDTKYGLAESALDINSTALATAITLCDQAITLTAGGTQPRYTLDGLIDTANSKKDNIEGMLTAMAGSLSYSGGEYFISGAAYVTPTVTIDESVMVGGIEVQTKQSRRSLYNGVKGVFRSEDEDYVVADYPAQLSSTFSTEDGDPIYLDLALPFTTNNIRAQRIAKLALLRSRQQTAISVPCNLSALKFRAGDNIMVTNAKMGWSSKVFQVTGYDLSLSGSGEIVVNVQAIETAAAIYDWTSSDQQDYLAGGEVALYNGRTTQPPTSLTVTSTTVVASDGTLLPSLRLNWTASADIFVTHYEVQYQRGSAIIDLGSIAANYDTSENYGLITDAASVLLDYGSIDEAVETDEPDYNSTSVTTPQYIIVGVTPSANYNIRIRAVNELGVKSNFVTLSGLAQGDTDAPAIPDSVTASGGLKEVTISWVPPTDPDYSHVEVWENTVNNFATSTKTSVAGGDSFTRTGLGYNVLRYYWLKSVDYSGNISAESSVASATTLFVDTDSFSQAVNDLFSESGAYGIEPVSSLPASGDFNGQIKYHTTENKLYRWDSATSAWTDDIFSIESGTVDAASFASGIEPISILTALPNPSGYTGPKLVFLTTDNKIYRYTGSAWTSEIPAADIGGALASANFPTNLRPIEIVTALPTTGNFQGRQVFLTTDNKTYRYNGTAFIATIATTDLQGTIASTQLAAAAVTNAKIAVNAIQGDVIAAGAITAAKILDGAISELKLANDAVTTAKIAADAITADVIAAGAITSDAITAGAITSLKIANDAVTNAKIAVDAVQGDVIAANAITADKLLDGAVSELKIAAGAVTTAKIATDAITAGVIAAGAITETKIASNAITSAKIAANTITAGNIAAGAITADAISANAITTAKINAGAVVANSIAADAITTAKIAAGAITADEIAAAAITTGKIAAGAVTADEISANAITSGKIAANTIVAADIAADAITATELSAGSVTTAKLDAAAITSEKIAAGAITADTIAANAITSAKIQAGAVVAESIAADAITTAKIAAGAITADEISAAAITTGKIAANAVTATEIAADSITAVKIAANAVTADSIAANSITSIKIAADAITANEIATGAVTADSISAGSITTAAIAADAITANLIAADAITAAKISANAITSDKISANAITAGKIQAGAVSADAIAANSVTSAKIFAGAITTDKIAANAITAGLIAASGVITDTAQISNAVIEAANISSLAVTSAKIADLAVTSGKIANLAVDTLQIADQAVTLPSGAFTSGDYYTYYPAYAGQSGWQTIQSITFTQSANVPAEIFWSFLGKVKAGDTSSGDYGYGRIEVRIQRNNVTVLDYGILVEQIREWDLIQMINGSFIDTNASGGSATYTLQVQRTGDFAQVSNRSLITTELKK